MLENLIAEVYNRRKIKFIMNPVGDIDTTISYLRNHRVYAHTPEEVYRVFGCYLPIALTAICGCAISALPKAINNGLLILDQLLNIVSR